MVIDRHKKLRKTARNQMLFEYARTHPDDSLSDIGAVFNITRQRVWELLQTEQKRNQATAEQLTTVA